MAGSENAGGFALDGTRYRRLSAALDEYVNEQTEALAGVAPEHRRLNRSRLREIFQEHDVNPAEFGLDLSVEGESELLLSLRLAHAEVKLAASLVDDIRRDPVARP